MILSYKNQLIEIDKIVIIDYLTPEERNNSNYANKLQELLSSNQLIEFHRAKDSIELVKLLRNSLENCSGGIIQIISHGGITELGKIASDQDNGDCRFNYNNLNKIFYKINRKTKLIVNLMTVCGSYHYNNYIFTENTPQYICLIGSVQNSPYLTSLETSRYLYSVNGVIPNSIEERVSHINEDQDANFSKPETIYYDTVG